MRALRKKWPKGQMSVQAYLTFCKERDPRQALSVRELVLAWERRINAEGVVELRQRRSLLQIMSDFQITKVSQA